MKTVLVVGVVLVVTGLLEFAYQGFTYTTRETVAEVGSLKVTGDQEHSLPRTISGLTLGAGVVLLVVGTTSAWLSRRPSTRTSMVRKMASDRRD